MYQQKPLTVRQKALISAINNGVTTLRDLMREADYGSTSVVKYNLEVLAEHEHVQLVDGPHGEEVYDGSDFAAAWDAAARLAGNPEA